MHRCECLRCTGQLSATRHCSSNIYPCHLLRQDPQPYQKPMRDITIAYRPPCACHRIWRLTAERTGVFQPFPYHNALHNLTLACASRPVACFLGCHISFGHHSTVSCLSLLQRMALRMITAPHNGVPDVPTVSQYRSQDTSLISPHGTLRLQQIAIRLCS